MKTFLSIIGTTAIIIIIAVVYGGGCENNAVTNEIFQKSHQFLNQRIDTIQWKLTNVERTVTEIQQEQRKMQTDIDKMSSNIDSLKVGQNLIYNVVTSQEGRGNWATQLLKLWNN